MNKKVKIQPYLDYALREALASEAKRRRVSESEMVTKALTLMMDPDNDERREQLMVRRFDRLQRELRQIKRDTELLLETLSMFVKVFLANTHEIPAEHKDAAKRNAMLRYTRFIEAIADRIGSGKLFIDDLPRDLLLQDQDFERATEEVLPVKKDGFYV